MIAGCVLGTGIDLVENARMESALKRWGAGFKNRVFLPGEQVYCDSKQSPVLHYAVRFAVKEAVSKALRTGVGRHIGWLDIEVVRENGSGAPGVRLSERGRKLTRSRGIGDIHVSLSHTRRYAIAQAVVSGSMADPP